MSSKPFLKRYFGMGVRRLNDSQVDVTARAEFFAQRTAIYSAIYSAKISPFITTCRTAEKQKKDESILLDVMKMEIENLKQTFEIFLGYSAIYSAMFRGGGDEGRRKEQSRGDLSAFFPQPICRFCLIRSESKYRPFADF